MHNDQGFAMQLCHMLELMCFVLVPKTRQARISAVDQEVFLLRDAIGSDNIGCRWNGKGDDDERSELCADGRGRVRENAEKKLKGRGKDGKLVLVCCDRSIH